jgi:hypothetical protein
VSEKKATSEPDAIADIRSRAIVIMARVSTDERFTSGFHAIVCTMLLVASPMAVAVLSAAVASIVSESVFRVSVIRRFNIPIPS